MAELTTDRLRLRKPSIDDFEGWYELYADPEVARFIGKKRPMSREESWRHLAMMIGHWELRGFGMFAVVEKETEAMIGRIGFFEPEGWPGFELGWAIGSRYWGRGLATEGARAALRHAFEALDRDRVISLIDPANERSVRLAVRLGERFQRTTRLKGRDVSVYGIDRDAWRSS